MKILRLLILVLFFPAISFSCTCASPSFQEEWEKSTAVFRAKVIHIVKDGGGRRIEMVVSKSWKGPAEKRLYVFSESSTASCGYPFAMEKEYLVYATGKEKLQVSLCSRTRLVSEAGDDLAQLVKKSESKRDPFTEMAGERIQSDKLIPRELNITNAVIVGITKTGDEYTALIRATNNKVYFLKVGDKLHDGAVLKIDNNSVTFRKYKGYRSVLVKKELRPFPDP